MTIEVALKKWTALASHYIGEHFDLCRPFLDREYLGLDPLVRFVSTQLYLSCQFSSESSLLLLREGQEWDAEIVNRSIAEGVVKYVYMLEGSSEEMLQKVKEYWEVLPDYAAIRRSERAHELLKAANGYSLPEWRAIEELALDVHDVEKLRRGSDRKSRKRLEQKWSFSEILKGFANSNNPSLSPLVHLAYNYGMNSHLSHKDADGVGMVWERDIRELVRRNAVKQAHIARSISDICTFSDIRSLFLMRCCGQDSSFISELHRSYAELFEDISAAGREFNSVEYGT